MHDPVLLYRRWKRVCFRSPVKPNANLNKCAFEPNSEYIKKIANTREIQPHIYQIHRGFPPPRAPAATHRARLRPPARGVFTCPACAIVEARAGSGERGAGSGGRRSEAQRTVAQQAQQQRQQPPRKIMAGVIYEGASTRAPSPSSEAAALELEAAQPHTPRPRVTWQMTWPVFGVYLVYLSRPAAGLYLAVFGRVFRVFSATVVPPLRA